MLQERGIEPVTARRTTKHGSGFGSTRWVVERMPKALKPLQRARGALLFSGDATLPRIRPTGKVRPRVERFAGRSTTTTPRPPEHAEEARTSDR